MIPKLPFISKPYTNTFTIRIRHLEKISLLPGESRVVEFHITEELLKFVKRDMTYGAEKGSFHIFIGKDSRCAHFAELKYS